MWTPCALAKQSARHQGNPSQYPLHTFPIMHLICPPNNLHKYRFQFVLGQLLYPGEIKNKGYAICFALCRCIMRNVQVVYCDIWRLTCIEVRRISTSSPLSLHFTFSSAFCCSLLGCSPCSFGAIRWVGLNINHFVNQMSSV